MSSLRKCKKINCTEFAEYRKQFCITHRRKLKPNTNLESKIDDNSFERSNLINEQNIDYEESLRVDMENRYQKDIEEALKISLKIERIEQVEKKKKEIEIETRSGGVTSMTVALLRRCRWWCFGWDEVGSTRIFDINVRHRRPMSDVLRVP